MFSRLLFAVARRLPFKIEKLYVPAMGQVINRPGDSSSVFGEIFVSQIYQPIAPLPHGATAVDLGSNVGYFTIFINQRIKDGKIFVFEASPKAFAHLENNISRISRKNGNTIDIHNVAICDYSGEIDFMVDNTHDSNVAAAAYRDISTFQDADHFVSIRIPCETIGHYVKGRIDFLKCDIEGAEYGVLTDELLNPAKVGQFVVEFHDIDEHRSEFDHIIETSLNRGYAIYDKKNEPVISFDDLHRVRKELGLHSTILKFCAKSLLN